MACTAIVIRRRRLLALAFLVLAAGMPGRAEEPGLRATVKLDFDRAVAPVLARRCLDCHSGPKPKGGLDLSHRKGALEGGENGPAIVAGQPDKSLLWEYVEAGKMPPKAPLPDAERDVLKAWLAAGAGWGTDPIDTYQFTSERRAGRDWWSLQPVTRPRPPALGNAGWGRGPLDTFVLRQLTAKGLEPSPQADRRTLIRRLYFDMLGLPPAPEEVDAFLADCAPGAYERLVERCLASPHYGVRWARLWLDLARYGESNGFEFDEFRPSAWRYRDWVVNSFNLDMPYDEFARRQMAGDVLHPGDPDAIEATGFLVAGAYDSVGQNQQSDAMKAVVRQDELEDMVGAVGQTFLGLTVNCARCHDHKFDPVRQVEYYRMAAALGGVRHGERDLTPLDERAIAVNSKIKALESEAAALAGSFDQAVLGSSVVSPLENRERYERLRAEIADLRANADKIDHKCYAVAPRQAGPTHVLIRGNTNQPGEVISAGGVGAVAGLEGDFHLPPDAPESEGRKRLAAWITDHRNPLFARVIVNRLWQAHFGTGLVETPSDLGYNGGKPGQPQVLDWLASELAAQGYRLKVMHRLIVTSAAYRQGVRQDQRAMSIDAGNRLLWRGASRRLEAEMVRDAMLAVAGSLDSRLAGPSFQDHDIVKAPGTAAILYVPADPSRPGLARRTLYRAWTRGGRSAFLDSFDCPDPSTTAPRRAATTTPLQALALLNNALVLHLADLFAERLEREAGPDPAQQVERAYQLAFGRRPRPEEYSQAAQVVKRHGAATLARAIFNSNEFVHIN
jgi:hypothetical protein